MPIDAARSVPLSRNLGGRGGIPKSTRNKKSEGGAAMTGMFERWKDLHIGEPIDQPVIFALLVIAIAITLYIFA